MAGHVHPGNSTVVINGTYFVTTRTLGGSVDTSHGFRTYVVYPDGRVQINPETLTYKNYAVVAQGTNAAQIYADSDLLPGTIAIDLPGQYQGLKALNGTAQLVEAKKHPLTKYTRYYISIVGKPIWLAIGDYAPALTLSVEKIMPRSLTHGDVVTITIKAEDPNVGTSFLTVDGKKILASYPGEQPVYQYRFRYDKPTTLQIQAPGGQPTTVQIGQAT